MSTRFASSDPDTPERRMNKDVISDCVTDLALLCKTSSSNTSILRRSIIVVTAYNRLALSSFYQSTNGILKYCGK